MSNVDDLGTYPYEPANELISVENLSLSYSDGPAILENLNFNIYHGEFVCVMGPSGCGKSTLLNILAGFLSPTQGRATLNQTEIRGIDWNRGVIFQRPPLFEWYSVRKNVAFGPRMRKVPKEKVDADVETYLKRVGLLEAADKKVFELSGGMQQRVAIARVLINNPEILLMDEPFGALDALTREQMQSLVRKIWHNTGKTILFITHDVDEALKMGTRALIMARHPGRIAKDLSFNFTRDFIQSNDDGKVWFQEKYYELRKQIMDTIYGASDNPESATADIRI